MLSYNSIYTNTDVLCYCVYVFNGRLLPRCTEFLFFSHRITRNKRRPTKHQSGFLCLFFIFSLSSKKKENKRNNLIFGLKIFIFIFIFFGFAFNTKRKNNIYFRNYQPRSIKFFFFNVLRCYDYEREL